MKVFRGISKSTGTHSFAYGKGLYTTKDRAYARQFAGPDGQVLELDAADALPSNALKMRDHMAWQNWLDRQMIAMGYVRNGFPDGRRFNAEVGDPGKVVRKAGHDGVQIGTGRDTVYVKYTAQAEDVVEQLLWMKTLPLEHRSCPGCGHAYGHHNTRTCAHCEECSKCCRCSEHDFKTLAQWAPILLERL